MRCEPKLTVGNEIVRALPRPSSSETLRDCAGPSIGNTGSLLSGGSVLLTTLARSLLKSTAVSERFGFATNGRSIFRFDSLFTTITGGALVVELGG